MKVYCASKARHWPWWTALQAAGVPIVATWPSAEFNSTGQEPSLDGWRQHWSDCISEAASADVTLVYAREGERQMGALVEAGAALGAGRQVYLVSDHAWSWRHHPNVRNFESLDKAIGAIVAAHAVERDRGRVSLTGVV
jgi:hypothetical protein